MFHSIPDEYHLSLWVFLSYLKGKCRIFDPHRNECSFVDNGIFFAGWTHTFGDMEFYGIFHSHVAAVWSGQSLSSLRKLLCWREWQSYRQWLSLRLKPATVVIYLGAEAVKYQPTPFWFSLIHLYLIFFFFYSQNVNGIKYHAKNGHRTQIRVHKPFKCRCGKSYKTSQGLRHHTVNLHPLCLHWLDAEDAAVQAEEMSSAVSQVMSAELSGHQHCFLTPPLVLPYCSVIFTIYDTKFWSHDTTVTSAMSNH